MTDLTGIPIPLLEPGSPEWLRCMSASKVAAVLGLSKYDSPFSLYHRMRGTVAADPDNELTRRGHYLEPAIRAWFADQHPDWAVQTTGSWRHPDRHWQTASPDGLVVLADGAVEGFEAKSAISDEDEWGEPGTDQVPVGVRAQVQWQMDTIGTRRTHVACLSAFLEFKAYVVDYDPADVETIRDASAKFLARVEAGQQPSIDEAAVTYRVLRELHPDIDDVNVEISMGLANDYRAAVDACKAAETAKQLQTSLIAEAMGNARRAVDPMGVAVAIRTSKQGGTPFVQVAKTRSSTS
jgi:putative phage-type endonuclease